MYDQLTWNDIQYQEEHGHLPEKGMTADEMHELFANCEPDEIAEILRLNKEDHDDHDA